EKRLDRANFSRGGTGGINVIVGPATDAETNANHYFDRSIRRSNESKTTIRPDKTYPLENMKNAARRSSWFAIVPSFAQEIIRLFKPRRATLRSRSRTCRR